MSPSAPRAAARRPIPTTGALGFRPKDMKPIWAEVPMLYTLGRWTQGLVPYVKPGAWSKGDGNAPGQAPGAAPSPNGGDGNAGNNANQKASR